MTHAPHTVRRAGGPPAIHGLRYARSALASTSLYFSDRAFAMRYAAVIRLAAASLPCSILVGFGLLPVGAMAGTTAGGAAGSPVGRTAPAPPMPATPGAGVQASCPTLLDARMPRLQDEAPQDLCQYAGRVVLVVNTASFCGFTPQYRALERLHERYRARGLVVLGFPSNDFSQEPGGSAEIATLCEGTFGVKFPMFAKSVVTGPHANPLHARLAKVAGGPPQWNFHKYLIGRDGRPAGAWPSRVEPDDAALVGAIEAALASAP